MSLKITPQQLTVINLRYGTTAKSLKTLTFADLAAKALFLSSKPLGIKEVASKVAELISVRSVSERLIKQGLEELKINRQVKLRNDEWELKDHARQDIEREAASLLDVFDGVLDRHFPKNIEREKLTPWFTDAIADFFAYNGDEWVQSVCKGKQQFSKHAKTANEILDESIGKHGLSSHSAELKNSFKGLLESTNTEDQRYLTNVGYAMFHARLAAADVGADPIALGELRGATFLVDTNFLFALQLENQRSQTPWEALEQALSTIGAKLLYLGETEDEYKRVWNGKRAEIIGLLKVYPNEIVARADDGFVSTAIARGCSDKESFETFFDSIYELPRQMPGGLKIEVLEDQEIAEEVEKAKNDNILKNAIQSWRSKLSYWHRPKSNIALGHDAALIYVSEFEQKVGNKVFILTLDRSLQACCAERVGAHSIPTAIRLEGLIQILAANSGGPELDATNFAPLLTSILLQRCFPPEHMYSPQDLHWLYGIQKNVSGFRPEKIEQIALEVTKARLSGMSADDEKLHRTVNRFYQEEKQKTNREVEEFAERARKAEDAVATEKTKRLDLEGKLREKEKMEAKRAAKRRLARKLSWRIPVTFVLAWISFEIVSTVLSLLQKENTLDLIALLLTLVGVGYKFLKAPIKEYSQHKELL